MHWDCTAEARSEVDPYEAEDSQEIAQAETGVVSEKIGEDSEAQQESKQENGSGSTQSTFSYEQLKAKSENPVTGIDFKRREVCPAFDVLKFTLYLFSEYFHVLNFSGLFVRWGISDSIRDGKGSIL